MEAKNASLLILFFTQTLFTPSLSSTECPPGTYMNLTNGKCQWCEAGSYQPNTGSTECFKCKKGMFSEEIAASSPRTCQNCARGTYSINTAECAKCPLNTVSPAGATDILECTAAAGYFGVPGRAGIQCPADFYCVQGTTAPTACPHGTISVAGSTQCTPGVSTVLLNDWIFGSAWILLFLAGILALGVYKSSILKGVGLPKPHTLIKIQIVH
jgi:hypothetical protein